MLPASSKEFLVIQANYRVWIHSETRTWHYNNIQRNCMCVYTFLTWTHQSHVTSWKSTFHTFQKFTSNSSGASNLSKSSTCSSGFLFFTLSLHKDKQVEKNVIIKWQSFAHTRFYLSAKINPLRCFIKFK